MPGHQQEITVSVASCVFCRQQDLSNILHETAHFLVLADHAPVVEGHLLVLPRAHFACYGAVPAALDAEFLALKAEVSAFCQQVYQTPVFFEHGVYHQTVYHAHLHVFPFGVLPGEIVHLLDTVGHAVQSQADIRAWYEKYGHYFYVERPLAATEVAGNEASSTHASVSTAALFPPDDALYHRVLGALRTQTGRPGGWLPPSLRYLAGAAKIEALAAAWQQFVASGTSEPM